jgi:flavin-dependent dehydrogenase
MIKILGGGIAGLTAAINLADGNEEVTVYEIRPKIGMRFKTNCQLLGNWDSKEDILSYLEKFKIKINWKTKLDYVDIYSSDLKYKAQIFSDERPIGYTLIRGGAESFECYLEKQAKKKGATVVTNFKNKINADIIAIGSKYSEKNSNLGLGYGVVLSGNFDKKRAIILFDYNLAPGGYIYLLPHSNRLATIALAMRKWDNPKIQFDKLLKHPLFKNIFQDSEILYNFSGIVNGTIKKIPETAKLGGSLLIGESACFQDNVFGFGMRYAIISAYLASKSILQGLDYDKLWKDAFLDELKRTRTVRKVLDKIGNNFLNKLVSNIGKKSIDELTDIWTSKNGLASYYFKALFKMGK